MRDIREYKLMPEGRLYRPSKRSRRASIWSVLQSLIMLAVLFINLGLVVVTVQRAHWIDPQPSLILTLFLALLTALLFVKSRVPVALSLPLALLIGCGVVFLQSLGLFKEQYLIQRFADLISGVGAWVRATRLGEPSPGTIHIALVFSFLAWIIGYFSAWVAFKWQNPWVAISCGMVAIMVNLHFWEGESSLYYLFYLFSGLLLIALFHFIKRSSQVITGFPQFRQRGWIYWGSVTFSLIFITMALSWPFPQLKIYQVEAFARDNNPWRDTIDFYWKNFFATVPSTGAVLFHGGLSNLKLGGSLELSEQVAFIIQSDRGNYWKTLVYDYYDKSEWKLRTTEESTLNPGTPNTGESTLPEYSELQYVVMPRVNTNVLPVPGELVSAEFPLTKRSFVPLIYKIDFRDGTQDKFLPVDIASLAATLRNIRGFTARSDRQITSRLPENIKLVNVERESQFIRSINVSRVASGEDLASVTSFNPVSTRQQYPISVRIPAEYTAEKLVGAGDNYPLEILDRYLQLPDDFSAKVQELAVDLTTVAGNSYEKALAIKKYLAVIPYSLTIETPPEDIDSIEYFLFTQKSGYCTYFASAMTLMLRSVDIPARVAVGYLSDQYDSEQQRFIIRDKNYHAWTEVYFPGYGWVLFDPTPPSAIAANTGITSGNVTDPYSLDELYRNQYPGYDPGQLPPAGSAPFDYRGLIAASVITFILLLFFLVWFMIYRRPAMNSRIYSRMVLLAIVAGLGPRPSQTALEYSAELAGVFPGSDADIKNITSVYLEVNYGKKPLDSAPREDLTGSWRRLRTALLKRFLHIQ